MLQDGGMTPSLIVGIGYRFDRARPLRGQYFETRTRDYTPSADAACSFGRLVGRRAGRIREDEGDEHEAVGQDD